MIRNTMLQSFRVKRSSGFYLQLASLSLVRSSWERLNFYIVSLWQDIQIDLCMGLKKDSKYQKKSCTLRCLRTWKLPLHVLVHSNCKWRMASGGECQKWRENYDHVVVFPALHGWQAVLLFYRKSKENQEISHISDFFEFICFPL